jgi:hypothetical protein
LVSYGTIFGMTRRLVSLMIVSCLVSLSGCTKWAEKTHPGWKEATSGEHLTNLFWNEVKAKNWAGLEAHVGAEFMGISPDRTLDKPALMDHLHAIDLQSFQIGEVETRPAGRDLLVSYTITARGSRTGKALPEVPTRMMSVWQELGHGWVLVAHSDVSAKQ